MFRVGITYIFWDLCLQVLPRNKNYFLRGDYLGDSESTIVFFLIHILIASYSYKLYTTMLETRHKCNSFPFRGLDFSNGK